MFDPANHNLTEGPELVVATEMNVAVEALSDGVGMEDASPVFVAFSRIAGELRGKSKPEIRRILAKAGVAQLFDELAEAGHI